MSAPALPQHVTRALLDKISAGLHAGQAGPETHFAPFDGSTIATLPTCSELEVADAVRSARIAQAGWAQRSFAERAEVFLRFHDLLVDRQDEVLDLMQWEVGKTRQSAWVEVYMVATTARHYARRGAHYLADRSVRGFMPGLTKTVEIRVPKGVVGIISPWNFPLYLSVADAIPALLAGNAVVAKPDAQTPLTLLWARDLMIEAGLPAEVFGVVAGPGPVVGMALVDNVDYIGFTGSTATGRLIGARAGERLIGCSLELGGKNPMVVRADADVDRAVDGLAEAAFMNSGQMCVHVERAIIDDAIYDTFRERLIARVQKLTLGQAWDYSSDLGPLVSAKQLNSVTRHVQNAVDGGAKVLIGGTARPEIGPFAYAPTVLEGVTPQMEAYGTETFGPVLSLYRAGSDDEALALANEGNYGLSASVYSRNSEAADRIARGIRAGSVNINDGFAAAIGSIEASMGGMGDSGLGRRQGPDGIRKYTEPQTIANQRLLPAGVPPFLSSAAFIKISNGQLRLLKKMGAR
ncbi:succinic semialdehyde dehydrogenase [Nocardioides sp. Bht2]|uniref:succinic semialdehyde dehydrogenase n=1 Tax=Nocardioides sp. Bht2 TaxID=3392297 RepID=UPI0039B588B0